MSVLESFDQDVGGERTFRVRLERARRGDPDLARTLVDIDLHTFTESTFSPYTAAALAHHAEVFLLRADDTVVGAATCLRSWEPADEALLLSIGLLPGWRGRGLGYRFVAALLDALRVQGIASVSLMVGSGNERAVGVYSALGFEVADRGEPDPYTGERQLLLRAALRDPSLADVG